MRLSANAFFSSHFSFQKEMLLAFHSKGELDKVDAALLNRLFPCDCSVFNFSSRSGVLDYRRYPKILVSNQFLMPQSLLTEQLKYVMIQSEGFPEVHVCMAQ